MIACAHRMPADSDHVMFALRRHRASPRRPAMHVHDFARRSSSAQQSRSMQPGADTLPFNAHANASTRSGTRALQTHSGWGHTRTQAATRWMSAQSHRQALQILGEGEGEGNIAANHAHGAPEAQRPELTRAPDEFACRLRYSCTHPPTDLCIRLRARQPAQQAQRDGPARRDSYRAGHTCAMTCRSPVSPSTETPD